MNRVVRVEGDLHYARQGFDIEERGALLLRLNPAYEAARANGLVDSSEGIFPVKVVSLGQRPNLCGSRSCVLLRYRFLQLCRILPDDLLPADA